ncbi:MAG: hypothetical protein JWO27_2228 [Frankiales bacterium]|nr:hypothetical protein [Frankiales bacterium]MCW2708630.1 hypothetical protein [Frankiales bacterium]
MRFFIDLEFGDTASVVTLVSVAAVAEDGREYYAVSTEFDPMAVHPWVAENVLPQLPPVAQWKPRRQIATELEEFFGDDPVWWAWYGAYDHVALCQLWGDMPSLPRQLPRFTLDVRQLWEHLGRPTLPVQENGLHDALQDARHVKVKYDALAEAAYRLGMQV